METALGQSMSPLPVSYKEALQRLEQSKALVSNVLSTKEELLKLRRVLRHLRPAFAEKGDTGVLRTASTLWERWLSLLEAAREWESWCGELKQEWKFVREGVEREAIILDNLQEELPELSKTQEAASAAELAELLDGLGHCEENARRQRLLLDLLLRRARGVQGPPGAAGPAPALQEITAMQERCHR